MISLAMPKVLATVHHDAQKSMQVEAVLRTTSDGIAMAVSISQNIRCLHFPIVSAWISINLRYNRAGVTQLLACATNQLDTTDDEGLLSLASTAHRL